MNLKEFNFMNTIHGYRYLSCDCQKLYDYFCYGGKKYKYDVLISFSEFEKIFNVVLDEYRTIFNEIEINKAFMQYIQLIMSDCVNGRGADVVWFINCIDYLSLDILSNSFLKKGKSACKNIKRKLILEFDINDKFRKVFGKYFVKKF